MDRLGFVDSAHSARYLYGCGRLLSTIQKQPDVLGDPRAGDGVRNPNVIARPLAEVTAQLPAGVRIFAVRPGNRNRVPAPDVGLVCDDAPDRHHQEILLLQVMLALMGGG